MVPYTTRGASVKVSSAKDLGVRCTEESSHKTYMTGVRLTDTFLAEEHRQEHHHELSAESDHAEAVDVIFELPKAYGVSVSKEHAVPFDETSSFRRFKLAAPAHGKASVKVVEQWPDFQRYEYASLGQKQVAAWLQAHFLDKDAERSSRRHVRAGRGAGAGQAARAHRAGGGRRVREKLLKLTEQLRVLKEGGAEGELRLRYVKELQTEQDRVNAFATEVQDLRNKADAARKRAETVLKEVTKPTSAETDGPEPARRG